MKNTNTTKKKAIKALTNGQTVNGYKPETYSWKSFSAFYENGDISGIYIALKEFLNNSLDAVKNTAKKEIWLNYKPSEVVCKDTGCSFETIEKLITVLDYSQQNKFQTGLNNMHNTGLKSALSFCYPYKDGSFIIYVTTDDGKHYKVSSPYNALDIEPIDVWPFDDKFKTVIKTKVEREEELPSQEDVEKWLNIVCWSMVRSYGIKVYFNGTPIDVVCPGHVKETTEDKYSVNGSEVTLKRTVYALDAGTAWKPSSETQGIWTFVAGGFAEYSAMSIFPARGKNALGVKIHNVYDELVTFIEIEPSDKKGMLPMNCCKTRISWSSAVNHRKNITALCRAPYDELSRKYAIANNAYKNELLQQAQAMNSNNQFAVKCNVVVNEESKISASAVFFKTASLQDSNIIEALDKGDKQPLTAAMCDNECVDTIMFYSSSTAPIDMKIAQNAEAFGKLFKSYYNYTPHLVIMGNGMTSDAERYVGATTELEYRPSV